MPSAREEPPCPRSLGAFLTFNDGRVGEAVTFTVSLFPDGKPDPRAYAPVWDYLATLRSLTSAAMLAPGQDERQALREGAAAQRRLARLVGRAALGEQVHPILDLAEDEDEEAGVDDAHRAPACRTWRRPRTRRRPPGRWSPAAPA
jgi:hypothetical protein